MMAATNTTVQNRVPDELRGRMMAVYATMFMGVQPIGSLIAGGVAKHIGAPWTLAVFGVIVLIGEPGVCVSGGDAVAAGGACGCGEELRLLP